MNASDPRTESRSGFSLLIRLPFCLAAVSIFLMPMLIDSANGQEAEWIWSNEHDKTHVPQTSCYFRKSFSVGVPERAQVTIAADDQYELFVNGRRVGSGDSYRNLDDYNITRYLSRGRNTIAVKVTNTTGSTAALAARVLVKEVRGGWSHHSTDASWSSNLAPLPLWNTTLYNDRRWAQSQSFGRLGDTAPWDRLENVVVEERHRSDRFTISREFQVQRVIDGEECGSLIAMTFNEFGHIIASREGGPLLLIYDQNNDGIPERVREYCDQVTNCQGILALNGEVFVTGDGPDGNALYRLSDTDRDGKLETVRAIVKFKGSTGEHGAHGIVLGPEGLLYIVVGNHVRPDVEYEPSSPHRDYYEGDLVPRYEDPGGHAAGVKVPGGVVIRTDIEGSSVQLVAGGLRNAYDLAFNRDGEMFIHDSDMESDIGSVWYRPTQVYHVIPGAEFGWRSGWAKWPTYFVDSLPPMIETGRGSPAGAVVYDHVKFPSRYHNALFLADWSEGRILAVRTKQQGATYTAESEVFLQGQPLNVTDLEVGPDGWLYFVTGGRGTRGGIYRVTWKGDVPEALTTYSSDIGAVIRQPQLHSAWGRQSVARLKRKIGDNWGSQMAGVARNAANPAPYRTRALDLLQLFGPAPDVDLLVSLVADPNESVRAKAASLLGLQNGMQSSDALVALLDDTDRTVRRKACEGLLRHGTAPALEQLVGMLASDDRYTAWAARRLLERMPLEEWRQEAIDTENHRLFIQGALALMIAEPTPQNALDVVDRAAQLMQGFVSDRDFVDLIRVIQVTMLRGELTAEDIPDFRQQLADEFPAGNVVINRELVRLLVFLEDGDLIKRYLSYLESDIPAHDKLHIALHMRFLESGWTAEQKLHLLEFYEKAQGMESGSSIPLYVMNATRDFARQLSEPDARAVLVQGEQWPNAALGALYRLPAQLDDDLRQTLVALDRRILDREEDTYTRLKTGIVAVLSRSADESSIECLHEIWEHDPNRRHIVALGLMQAPTGKNFELIVRSLNVLQGDVAREVLARLAALPNQPQDSETIRQVILQGWKLKESGSAEAIALLEHWTGQSLSGADEPWADAMAAWSKWFESQFPDAPDALLPRESEESKWKYDELVEFLDGEEARAASAAEGAQVFRKAQCAKCHRFGGQGEAMGPDLTSVAKRFTRNEILESIIYPSHVISSQYAAKKIALADGRTLAGIVAAGAQGETLVLLSNGEKVAVRDSDIDEIIPSKLSSMPDNLLDPLTLDEIAQLFAYLRSAPAGGVTRRLGSD